MAQEAAQEPIPEPIEAMEPPEASFAEVGWSADQGGEEPEAEAESLPPPAAEPSPRRQVPERRPPPPQQPRRPFQPAAPATIEQAIREVNGIVNTLRETLDDMEEVLESLELAERQKTADEQELESLRRALRNLQRPREGGGPQHSHPQRR